MTALNKQALREAAEKAGKDKWQAKKINGDFYVIRSGSYIKQCGITSYQPIAEIDHKPVRDFVAMVNPATTLALLDENLQLQREKDAIEAVALARIALAALNDEPVAYNQVQRDMMKDIIVRKLGGNLLGHKLMMADIHAVTMALIQAGFRTAQPASEREQIRREHAEWSDATFGDVGPVGPLKHLSKEALEAAADPSDPLEWADMQFLLWDSQRRMGLSDEFITRAMIEKLAINKARQWPEPKDGEPRQHVKEQPAPVVPPAIEPDYKVIKSILPTANPDEYACCIAADMWNACRSAMLNGGKS
ncbi:DUF550 domain-containing protein [Salmonella enterica subsp. enterica]|uniref:DUF550 domain-containing protein n=1 Tax=Salmonella enterica subsp. enterica serovar Give TaxID=46626 RepID=A0A5Z9NUM2_SALET|nr:DUF550 domain-containing protein [Salmonella enterica]EBH3365154.1 DUF550 domain-containing protein [Salmonella enterica subsp. enterica serovar Give]EBP8326392.1 DUF550 domain-containing protein [Salmonella enterica subsp. enterica]EAY3747731.1 DUF550 domain-containing protein [Salmonella enterica]EBM7591934.1 DUF550 domain-containing protein [Salmonella enterica subsp. enterica serovar Give]